MATQYEFAKKWLNQQREFLAKLNRHMPFLSSDQLKFFISNEGTDALKKVLNSLAFEYWKSLWEQYYKNRWGIELYWSQVKVCPQPKDMTGFLVMHEGISLKKIIKKISNPPDTFVNWNPPPADVEDPTDALEFVYYESGISTYSLWYDQEPFVIDTYYGKEKTVADVQRHMRMEGSMNLLELLLLNDFMVQMQLTDLTSIFNDDGNGGILSLNDKYEGSYIFIQCPRPEYRNPDILINTCDFERHLKDRSKCRIHMKKVKRSYASE